MTLAVSATEETKAGTVITDPLETSPALPTQLRESLSALSRPGPYQSLGTALAAMPVLGSCTTAKHQPRPPCLMPTAVRALKPSLCSCVLTQYQPDLHCHALTKGDAVQPRKSMLTALVATSIPTVVPVSCAYLSPQHYLCVCNWTLPLYKTCSCALELSL